MSRTTTVELPRERAPDRPPAIPPSVEPMTSEIADVTVITVRRELKNSHHISPPDKHA